MHNKRISFQAGLTLVLIIALMAAVLPASAEEAGGVQTLQVAKWSDTVVLENVNGRPAVIYDGATYHMWYGSPLHYTSSDTPNQFDVGTEVTGLVEGYQSSPAVVKEDGTFYMINYGDTTETRFNLYSSPDGITWTDEGTVYDGAGLADWERIDAPNLLLDGDGYKLYFQVRSSADTHPYSIYLATAGPSLAVIAGNDNDNDFTLANAGAPVLSPTPDQWDGLRVMHPMVVKDGGSYYMWYTAYGTSQYAGRGDLGFAFSDEGISWIKGKGNPIIDSVQVAEASVIKAGDTWHLWYLDDGKISYTSANAPFQFSSIQSALDAAGSGDTIQVAAGNYSEPLTIDKSIKLYGPNAAINPNDPSAPRVEEAVLGKHITLAADVDNIEIKGFTFSEISQAGSESGVIEAQGSPGNDNFVLENNIFDNINGLAAISRWQTGGTPTGWVIRNNRITDITGTQETGLYLAASFNNITITGNYIENTTYAGINVQSAVDSVISGNMVKNVAGQGIQLAGANANVEVFDNVIDNAGKGLNEPDKGGIRLYGTDVSGPIKVYNNTVRNSVNGVGIRDGEVIAGKDIQIYGNLLDPSNEVQIYNGGTGILNASPNWFGSAAGPAQDDIFGDVSFSPWCGDEACSFTVGENEAGELVVSAKATGDQVQDVLDDAPQGATIVIPDGAYNKSGGFEINKPGVTIKLQSGATIQNNSPCFVVSADNVRIQADPGARCIPTGSSAGIEVAAGVQDLVIEGIEIDGTGQSSSAGIHFQGAVTDVVIVNSYIHDLSSDGTDKSPALLFNSQPQGVVEIQGNLFKNTGGIGGTGLNINATYNSWGSYVVTDGMVLAGTGTVTYAPWTYADLSVKSLGDPWADQVVKGDTITYGVYGNFQNVMGAEFTLNYPDNLTHQSNTIGAVFANGTLNHDVPGKLVFTGYRLEEKAPVTGENLLLFTVTFTANETGAASLDLDEATDSFSMAPESGPSNLIYASALSDDVVVQVIDLPTLSSTNLEGPYVTGMSREFQVSVANPATGGTFQKALFRFTVHGAAAGDVASFQYKAGDAWLNMPLVPEGENLVGWFGPSGGFPIGPGYSATTTFRVTFNTAKQYPVSISLVDQGTEPDTVVVTLDKEVTVYAQPTLSSTLAGPYLMGKEYAFGIGLLNPADGGDFTNVRVRFVVKNATSADIASIQYLESTTGKWEPLGLLPDGNGNLVGWFGPAAGFPIMPKPYNATSQFKVVFAGDASRTFEYELELYDLSSDPDWLLATFSDSFEAQANFTVTGTVSMQGRTSRADIPMTLVSGSAEGKVYNANSSAQISSNLIFSQVVADTYTITTNQPRYLNISADLGKSITVSADTTLPPLELKGGNANWSDNEINLGDASVVGSAYGQTVDTDGDVNFSGKVDIFDLALVGGNFDLTSADAYGAWSP